MNILFKDDIRRVESSAADGGFSYERMMENAGSAAAGVICEKYAVEGKTVAVLAGGGNNGGDGFVVARKLYDAGAKVSVILMCGLPKTETAHNTLVKLSEYPIAILNSYDDNAEEIIKDSNFIVDAVFGIGFSGKIDESVARFFKIANSAGATRIALDLPSGCECDSGATDENAFCAEMTVTFIAVKPCHTLYPSSEMCGKTVLVGIGIPRRIITECDSGVEIITPELVSGALPKLPKNAHKGSCGRVAQLCGSYGMAGAAVLSATAAQKSGCGLVNCILPSSIYEIVAANVIEAVYTVVPENDVKNNVAAAVAIAESGLKNADSVLIGCGLGVNEYSAALVKTLLPRLVGTAVIDADGINILAENINILSECKADVVITPHPAEMARLIGCDTAAVQKNRYAVARAVAQRTGAVVVLKGANTVVASPKGKLFVCMNGNAGMATAGSGDVLAGIISALAASGMKSEYAALCGVYIHAVAGDFAAQELSMRSVTARDIADNIYKAFKEL